MGRKKKLKVGNYVRTTDGFIAKLEFIEESAMGKDFTRYIFDNFVCFDEMSDKLFSDVVFQKTILEKEIKELVVAFSDDIYDLIEENDIIEDEIYGKVEIKINESGAVGFYVGDNITMFVPINMKSVKSILCNEIFNKYKYIYTYAHPRCRN